MILYSWVVSWCYCWFTGSRFMQIVICTYWLAKSSYWFCVTMCIVIVLSIGLDITINIVASSSIFYIAVGAYRFRLPIATTAIDPTSSRGY